MFLREASRRKISHSVGKNSKGMVNGLRTDVVKASRGEMVTL